MPKLDLVGRMLTKFTVKEQYEMTLIAIGGMLILTAAMAVYMLVWMQFTTVFKIMLGINAFFGVLFLFSMLASTYAQYKMYSLSQGVNDMTKIIQGLTSGLSDAGIDINELKGGDK